MLAFFQHKITANKCVGSYEHNLVRGLCMLLKIIHMTFDVRDDYVQLDTVNLFNL